VQWHPERMDYANPLSGEIVKEFIRQSDIYFNQHQKNKNK
jgi:gamma-glutamyl-gamma-aminobutyrate hydrolase PuuD